MNGYVDLGSYWGATPFVGAGIGVADNALSSVSDQGFAIPSAGAAYPVGGDFSNASSTRFAWALMAGLDFDIAPNLRLELSYRYLNLGAIAVGGLHCRHPAPYPAQEGRSRRSRAARSLPTTCGSGSSGSSASPARRRSSPGY